MPLSSITFVRATVIAILVGLAALVAIVGTTLWLVGETRDYFDTVTSARLQRSALVDLRGLLQDAETGQRGYLLTGDDAYLKPYEAAESKIAAQLDDVHARLLGNPVQEASSDRLSRIVTAKFAEMRKTIDLEKSGRHDEAVAIVKTNRGLALMNEARDIFANLVSQAEATIITSVERQQRSISALRWITLLGALVIFIVVGGAVWMVLRYTRQLVEAQNEVRTLNAGLEGRVRERTAELGRANEEIQRFAYIVTHDLRAPLVNIMGFTSELETGLTSVQSYVKPDAPNDEEAVSQARTAALEEMPEAIGFIRSSTRKMDGLINAILKLSREGRRMLKPERIELQAVLDTAAASIRHQVVEVGGEVSIDGSVPSLVSDRLALEQIFGNLFDNAVKYRARDRPLQIHVRAREEPGQRISVEVEDNGRGIASQDHGRVFDLFRRSGTQDQPGEGIGLAHVRTMIRSLGGEITLRSQIAQGTTLTLTLPRDLRTVTGAA